MASSTKLKDGRRYKVDSLGIDSLRKKFQIVMDAAMGAEDTSFASVPAIGSAHPSFPYLFVQSYDVEEGEGPAKHTLTVYVNYGRQEVHTEGSGQDAYTCAVEKWGWDSSTDQKDLVTDATGAPVLNSAHDPFDQVPQVAVYAPVFTKIIKFTSRQSGVAACNCKVNSAAVTIGDLTCPAGSLLCSVEEERLIGDPVWKYRYTVRLKYKTNRVKLMGSSELVDIGWDVAVTDAGMRELDAGGKPVLIKQIDGETGKRCTVTSPELLDGQGHAVARDGTTAPTPYNFHFQAYDRTTFPGWFYSETDIPDASPSSSSNSNS